MKTNVLPVIVLMASTAFAVTMPEITNGGYYASATTQKEIAAHIAHRLREGVVDPRRVKASAKRVLEQVMRSPRFAATRIVEMSIMNATKAVCLTGRKELIQV